MGFDYIFIGAGTSNSLLALNLEAKGLLQGKRCLLLDPLWKQGEEKTFCFWEQNDAAWLKSLEALPMQAWDQVQVPGKGISDLGSMRYWQVKRKDLDQVMEGLANKHAWEIHNSAVNAIEKKEEGLEVQWGHEKATAPLVFDSRPLVYPEAQPHETFLWQSFHGWLVQTRHDHFHPDSFTMMDFGVVQEDFTQFVYVLPLDKQHALVEMTRFGAELLSEDKALQALHQYLSNCNGSYQIRHVEQGAIPMCNIRPMASECLGLVPMGSGKNLIKPSTGYAFKQMQQHAIEICAHLEQEQRPASMFQIHAPKGRYAFYDRLLLWLLMHRPTWGKRIFERLFQGVPIPKILNFLDEKGSIWDDAKIFLRLPWAPFLEALLHVGFPKSARPALLLLISLVLLFLPTLGIDTPYIGQGLLMLGLLSVGIPHGAVDHLLETGHWKTGLSPGFILGYIGIGAVLAMIWFWFPFPALLFFILFSAWHFGQADAQHWNLEPILGFAWGIWVLAYILGTHAKESSEVIQSMLVPISLPALPYWTMLPWVILGLGLRKTPMVLISLSLGIASQLPLMQAFGLYFIGQHSLSAWQHVRQHLGMSHFQVWRHSLIFHLGAWLIFLLFFFFWPKPDHALNAWGPFFIFIACLSLPHSIIMHGLYRRNLNQQA